MIRILTDSTADILPKQAKELGITVIPLQVNFENDKSYLDGIDLTPNEFYEKLKTCKQLPTTSQPSPNLFIEQFEDAAQCGDQVVVILLSGELSGTFQSAQIAKQTCSADHVFLVDSRTVTLGLQLLVRRAVVLRKQGFSANEIFKTLQKEKDDIRIVAIVDSLKYLQKGGRLSGAAALAGSMLGIKPLVQVKDGVVTMAAKARGLCSAREKLYEFIDRQGGIDTNREAMVGYTADPENAKPLLDYLLSLTDYAPKQCCCIGTVVGTHAGPGASGIAFFVKPQTDN